MRNHRYCLIALVPILGLAGCGSLPLLGGMKEALPDSIYTLKGGTAPSTKAATGNSVVVVPKPELPPGLETERIALSFDQGRRVDYYANAKWSAPLDSLLQDFIVDKAKQKLAGKAVGTRDLAASAKYKLALKFNEFGPVYEGKPDAPPRLDIGVTVTVLTGPKDAVKTQFTLKKSAPVEANNLTVITGGLEKLLQDVTDEALAKAAPSLG
jgi:ABC-type uncharacterized transport system auxiliary subunit